MQMQTHSSSQRAVNAAERGHNGNTPLELVTWSQRPPGLSNCDILRDSRDAPLIPM